MYGDVLIYCCISSAYPQLEMGLFMHHAKSITIPRYITTHIVNTESDDIYTVCAIKKLTFRTLLFHSAILVRWVA